MIAVVSKKKKESSPISQRLRAIRLARGLTQVDLGEKIGQPQATVARMETASTWNPSAETILKLAAALGCTPNDLLGYPGKV